MEPQLKHGITSTKNGIGRAQGLETCGRFGNLTWKLTVLISSAWCFLNTFLIKFLHVLLVEVQNFLLPYFEVFEKCNQVKINFTVFTEGAVKNTLEPRISCLVNSLSQEIVWSSGWKIHFWIKKNLNYMVRLILGLLAFSIVRISRTPLFLWSKISYICLIACLTCTQAILNF